MGHFSILVYNRCWTKQLNLPHKSKKTDNKISRLGETNMVASKVFSSARIVFTSLPKFIRYFIVDTWHINRISGHN